MAFLAAWSLSAQPACVYVSDSGIYKGAAGMSPLNGTIDDTQAYSLVAGSYLVAQSQGRMTVTNGQLRGAASEPSICFPPNSVHTMAYTVRRTGGLAGSDTYVRYWMIPPSGGPYKVSAIETATAPTPSIVFIPSQISKGPEGSCFKTVGGVPGWYACAPETWDQLTITWDNLSTTVWNIL
jgi:hypothetical protein